MRGTDIRSKTEQVLKGEVKKLRSDLEKVRFDKKLGKLKDTNLFKKTRKEIARNLTILKEKEFLREKGK